MTFPLVALFLLPGCGDSHADSAAEKPPPAVVVVSAPVEVPIVDSVDFTGRTDAAETVEIRARVTGFLDKVSFDPGAEVKIEQPLYAIDDREFQADLQAAQGDLAVVQAQLEKATADLKRATLLKAKGNVSAEEFDRADAAMKEADAKVLSAKAKQDRAALSVVFSKIAAPISGKISRTQITEGNLVSADTTLLTTIVSVDPMYAYFNVDERTLLTIRKAVRDGKTKVVNDKEKIAVKMGLAIDVGYPYEGTVDFIDNRVDPSTGTIHMRGVFANLEDDSGKRMLTPGLFARIRVPLGEPRPALLVTERAIGTDQGRKFVYVVDDKNEVVSRAVTLGGMHEGLREISEGLRKGERVIIDGLQRVRPGSEVTPKPGDMRGRPGDSIAQNEQRPGGTNQAADPATSPTKTPAE